MEKFNLVQRKIINRLNHIKHRACDEEWGPDENTHPRFPVFREKLAHNSNRTGFNCWKKKLVPWFWICYFWEDSNSTVPDSVTICYSHLMVRHAIYVFPTPGRDILMSLSTGRSVWMDNKLRINASFFLPIK